MGTGSIKKYKVLLALLLILVCLTAFLPLGMMSVRAVDSDEKVPQSAGDTSATTVATEPAVPPAVTTADLSSVVLEATMTSPAGTAQTMATTAETSLAAETTAPESTTTEAAAEVTTAAETLSTVVETATTAPENTTAETSSSRTTADPAESSMTAGGETVHCTPCQGQLRLFSESVFKNSGRTKTAARSP